MGEAVSEFSPSVSDNPWEGISGDSDMARAAAGVWFVGSHPRPANRQAKSADSVVTTAGYGRVSTRM